MKGFCKKFYDEWEITICIVIMGVLFILLMSTKEIVEMLHQ